MGVLAPTTLYYIGTNRSCQSKSSSTHTQNELESVQMRQLAKDLEPLVDLVAGERLQPLSTKPLHRKRAHNAAVEHGVFQHAAVYFALRGNVSHEASGKAVAGASGIAHFVQGQSRRAKRMMSSGEFAIAEEDGRTVLAVFDDQRARPQFQNLVRGARQAVV